MFDYITMEIIGIFDDPSDWKERPKKRNKSS